MTKFTTKEFEERLFESIYNVNFTLCEYVFLYRIMKQADLYFDENDKNEHPCELKNHCEGWVCTPESMRKYTEIQYELYSSFRTSILNHVSYFGEYYFDKEQKEICSRLQNQYCILLANLLKFKEKDDEFYDDFLYSSEFQKKIGFSKQVKEIYNYIQSVVKYKPDNEELKAHFECLQRFVNEFI